ncbi:hypothetical protein NW754_007789 [Fusarium falciforme]|nr:hypothetical protein NW754_007789 [Fusarium falciforme]
MLSSTGLVVNVTGLDVCTVNVTLTHDGLSDKVAFQIWLPLKGWNGRFQGTGGSGFSAGTPGLAGLAATAKAGFAVGMTDGGDIGQDPFTPRKNLIIGPGQLDLPRLLPNAPKYSYWTGCSTGGRQGYTLAQKYPTDFDGILAMAPALRYPTLFLQIAMAEFYANYLQHRPELCVLQAFQQAAVEACDALDGVTDSIISRPNQCNFDPYSLVGKTVDCAGKPVTVIKEDADLVMGVHNGVRSASGELLYEGYPWGTSTAGLAVIGPLLGGNWIKYFIAKDLDFDLTEINTLEKAIDFAYRSVYQWSSLLMNDNPQLSNFRDAGGKLLTWHGTADSLIPLNNTISYRGIVEQSMGSSDSINEFYRIFLVPGLDHCMGGSNLFPVGALEALMDWVEKSQAPDTLRATKSGAPTSSVERKLCLWPLEAYYNGKGDKNKASSYDCRKLTSTK